MQDKFVIGDVVVLKSGGPQMTVSLLDSDGEFWCCWFNKSLTFGGDPPDGQYLLEEKKFHSDVLIRVNKE